MKLLPALALAMLISDDACSARLDYLLTVYREFGLPLPPADASLVQKTNMFRGSYLDICVVSEEDLLEGRRTSITIVKPDPVALGKDTYLGGLTVAIQCHERGWHCLARAAFRDWLSRTHHDGAERQLALDAWMHWSYQFADGARLDLVAKYLKRAHPRTGGTTEQSHAFLRSLDLALVPSNSAPGSDDALIDELIEKPNRFLLPERSDAYRELARRGFAAIPALIAHLGDDRITRYTEGGFDFQAGKFLRVKDVVYDLIRNFAADPLETSNDIGARTFAVGRWFADAQKMGEEKYVVSRIAKEDESDSDVLLALMAEKFPARLPKAYRQFLDAQKGSVHRCDRYAKAIVKAALPLVEQLTVLEYAAKHDDPWHRHIGIEYLYKLDPKRAKELLIAALDRMGEDTNRDGAELVEVVPEDPDPKLWAALARAATRVPVEVRVRMFGRIGTSWRDEPDPACRRLRLAFVAAHLTDTDSLGVWDPTDEQLKVRDYAALSLAKMLGFEFEGARGADQWATFREQVWLAYEHAAPR